MKVAVTGASGFVGRHVINELLSRPAVEVIASSRAVPDAASWPSRVQHVELDTAAPAASDAYARLGRPDVLIHLAWGGLPNYRSLHHFETELPQQYRFLREMIEGGLPSLLITGTCYEYGMICGALDESAHPQPANPYAHAKNALREQLTFLRSKRPFALTWARLFYMYGDGQAPSSIYPLLMAAIARGDTAFRISAGEQLRDYLHVKQVASTIVDLALKRPDSGIVNVCSGQPVSIRALVERWLREQGATVRLELGSFPYPDHEPMAFWGRRERLDTLLQPAAPQLS